MIIERVLFRFAKVPAPAAQVPNGRCSYAIGDIHGHLNLLDGLPAKFV